MECEKALQRLCSAHLFVLREYPSTQSLTYLSNVSLSLSLSLQHLINSSTRFNEAAGKSVVEVDVVSDKMTAATKVGAAPKSALKGWIESVL